MKNIRKYLIFLGLGFLIFLGGLFFWQAEKWEGVEEHRSSVIKEETKPFLSFAVIGDPESDIDNLQRALEKVKEQNLSLAVLVGDLTKYGSDQQFQEVKEVLEKGEVNYFPLIGNHDLWLTRETGRDIYPQYFGDRYYSMEIEGLQFIFLDNADQWQGMGQTQLDWLAEKLRNDAETIIFSHIPFYHPESEKVMDEYSQELTSEVEFVLEKICQKPPLALISGHIHHTDDYFYLCPEGEKIRMINAGSVNETRNWQLPRFLRIDLFKSGDLEIEEVEI